MYGQRRWTVPALPAIKLVNTAICKIVTKMCVVVSPWSYVVRTRPRAVHSEIPVTLVHTCSDRSAVAYINIRFRVFLDLKVVHSKSDDVSQFIPRITIYDTALFIHKHCKEKPEESVEIV